MGEQCRLPTTPLVVGTRYIVEGEASADGEFEIISRYLIMPSGRRYDLGSALGPLLMANGVIASE